MIIKILLISLIFIVITLLISFLAQVFTPAVKKQTGLLDDMLLHKIEHDFEKLSKREIPPVVSQKAYVMCSCNKQFTEKKDLSVNKDMSCSVIFTAYKSLNDCKYSCIGLGDCVEKCSQEAIYIENGTAKVNNLCSGCGECINVCPKGLIKILPLDTKEIISCNNKDQPLTHCSMLNKSEVVEYKEKKGFKIWLFWYKLTHKSI